MTRVEFTKKVRAEAAARAGGHCERCTAKLVTGGIEYDHVIPAALGGEATLSNCEVLCRTCHRAKTSGQDLPRIAKTKRQAEKHWNLKPKRPWHPTLRRKMNGTVVPREKGTTHDQ